MNHKINHISMEELSDYLEEQLEAPEIQRVEAHLASGCPTCQGDLDWLRETLSLMASDDWVDPPNQVVAAVQTEARRLTKERQKQRRSEQPSLIDRLRALFYPRLVWGGVALAAVLLLLIATEPLSEKMVRDAIQELSKSVSNQARTNSSASVSDSILNLVGRGEFQKGDFTITSDQSGVSLRFFEQIVTRLEADTELSLVEIETPLYEKGHAVTLFQSSGKSSHAVTAAPSLKLSLQIETPAGVIVAKDSEFTVMVDSSGQTEVTVFSGKANVAAQDITMMAASGQTIIVEPGQLPRISP